MDVSYWKAHWEFHWELTSRNMCFCTQVFFFFIEEPIIFMLFIFCANDSAVSQKNSAPAASHLLSTVESVNETLDPKAMEIIHLILQLCNWSKSLHPYLVLFSDVLVISLACLWCVSLWSWKCNERFAALWDAFHHVKLFTIIRASVSVSKYSHT